MNMHTVRDTILASTLLFASSCAQNADPSSLHTSALLEGRAAQVVAPEVWFAPPGVWLDRETVDRNHIFSYPDQFDRTLSRIDVYVQHAQTEKTLTDSQRTDMLSVLHDYDIRLGLIVAGLRSGVCDDALAECQEAWGDDRLTSRSPECDRFFNRVGVRSAAHDLEVIDRLAEASRPLGYAGVEVLVMDGPLKRALFHDVVGNGTKLESACNFSVDRAMEQAFAYLEAIVERYPNMYVDWMINFLNWNYTLPNGTMTWSIRGPDSGFGQGHDARDIVERLSRWAAETGVHMSVSSEGGAEWYEGETWSNLWPEGAHQDWYARLIALRQQVEASSLDYNQGFSAVKNTCEDVDDPRELDACYARRDAWLRGLLMTHMDTYKRRAAARGLTAPPAIATFVQWNSVPSKFFPETDPQTFTGWVLEGITKL